LDSVDRANRHGHFPRPTLGQKVGPDLDTNSNPSVHRPGQRRTGLGWGSIGALYLVVRLTLRFILRLIVPWFTLGFVVQLLPLQLRGADVVFDFGLPLVPLFC
jgi:hypothetical protein